MQCVVYYDIALYKNALNAILMCKIDYYHSRRKVILMTMITVTNHDCDDKSDCNRGLSAKKTNDSRGQNEQRAKATSLYNFDKYQYNKVSDKRFPIVLQFCF